MHKGTLMTLKEIADAKNCGSYYYKETSNINGVYNEKVIDIPATQLAIFMMFDPNTGDRVNVVYPGSDIDLEDLTSYYDKYQYCGNILLGGCHLDFDPSHFNQ